MIAGSGTSQGGGVYADFSLQINETEFEANVVAANNPSTQGILCCITVVFARSLCFVVLGPTALLLGGATGGAACSRGTIAVIGGAFRGNKAVVTGAGLAQGGAMFTAVSTETFGVLFDSNAALAIGAGQSGMLHTLSSFASFERMS